LKQLLKENKLLVVLFSIFFLGGAGVLFWFDKGEFEWMVYQLHQFHLNYFFFFITYLGDGSISVLILFLLFIRKNYYGVIAFFSFILSTAMVQLMKRLIFAEHKRPKIFFEGRYDLQIIEWLELHTQNSFPSGHASGAFSIFIVLCLLVKHKGWSALYFSLALLTAFSRVYLGQHFFIDIYFGALIGTMFAVIVYFYIHYRSSLKEHVFFQRPLLKSFDNK
jgi:membrane-associated phospholipid phosphatase